MVLCLIALPIFAVLSIFSAKYRKLTLESLDCILRTATLRKCRSGLDDRIKSSLTGKVMRVSPGTAGFIYNNYRILSWIILVIFVWSTYGTSVGLYNYAKYGSCNGPVDTGFCMFDPAGANTKTSEIDTYQQSDIVIPTLEENDPIIGNKNAKLTIIEFGCYACPYTNKAEPIVKEVLDYYFQRWEYYFRLLVCINFRSLCVGSGRVKHAESRINRAVAASVFHIIINADRSSVNAPDKYR